MMSRPLLISLGMHALFAVIAVFGLPMLGRDLPEEMPIVRLEIVRTCLLYTSPSPRDATLSRMPSSA